MMEENHMIDCGYCCPDCRSSLRKRLPFGVAPGDVGYLDALRDRTFGCTCHGGPYFTCDACQSCVYCGYAKCLLPGCPACNALFPGGMWISVSRNPGADLENWAQDLGGKTGNGVNKWRFIGVPSMVAPATCKVCQVLMLPPHHKAPPASYTLAATLLPCAVPVRQLHAVSMDAKQVSLHASTCLNLDGKCPHPIHQDKEREKAILQEIEYARNYAHVTNCKVEKGKCAHHVHKDPTLEAALEKRLSEDVAHATSCKEGAKCPRCATYEAFLNDRIEYVANALSRRHEQSTRALPTGAALVAHARSCPDVKCTFPKCVEFRRALASAQRHTCPNPASCKSCQNCILLQGWLLNVGRIRLAQSIPHDIPEARLRIHPLVDAAAAGLVELGEQMPVDALMQLAAEAFQQ